MFSVHCNRQNIPFFRFNPALVEVISPGETSDEKLMDMMLQTRLYLQDKETQEELSRMVTLFKRLAQIHSARAQSWFSWSTTSADTEYGVYNTLFVSDVCVYM